MKTIKNRPKVCPTGWCDCYSCRYKQGDDCIYKIGEQDELLQEIARYVATLRGLVSWDLLPQKQTKDCGEACQEACLRQAKEILAKVKQHYEVLVEGTLRDFSDIQREAGHPESYWAGYHYARGLIMSALKLEQKRLDRPDKAQQLVNFLEDKFEVCPKERQFYHIRPRRKDWGGKLKELGLTWKGGW